MRLFEFEDNDKINVDHVYKFIQRNCSDFLKIANGRLLYRGDKDIKKSVYIGKSRNDRNNLTSDDWAIGIIDKNLEEQGFKALRRNSIFCTRDVMTAKSYGKLYIIFPFNKFNYTWSPDIHDLTASLKLSPFAIKCHKSNDWSKFFSKKYLHNPAQVAYNDSV